MARRGGGGADQLSAVARSSPLALSLAFAARQASAAVFGILILALVAATHLAWPLIWPTGPGLPDPPIHRYDALFLAAVAIQIALIAFRFETWAEAKVIAVFHAAGTVMELIRTSPSLEVCGVSLLTWSYPEDSFFRIATVPLFSGFMYAAVGSYIARSWRLHDFRLSRHPALWATGALAAVIYVNFFTYPCADLRWPLTAAIILLFWRSSVAFFPAGPRGERVTVPLLLVFFGIATLIYTAENIATWSNVWLYPHQEDGWRPVTIDKLGSWFLLMLLSWALVCAVRRPA